MKKMRQSLTIVLAPFITLIAWASIIINNGIMPIFLQWAGPPMVTIGIWLLRLRTTEAVCVAATKKNRREITHRDGREVANANQPKHQQS